VKTTTKRALWVLAAAALSVGCGVAAGGAEPAQPVPDLGLGANLQGYRLFPADNAWNRDISAAAVDPNSAQLIASIGADKPLRPDYGTFWDGRPMGMGYMVVKGDQAKVPMSFDYADESDPGPYPFPADAPVEGGPTSDGDRHVLVLDRDNHKLYETWDSHRQPNGSWHAGSGAAFDLRSNALRPAGWTSADAAGLPILPGLVRYDEVVGRGEINHALRFTCRRSRRAYVTPATHYASRDTSADLPPMGMRVRLKSTVDISGFPREAQVVLRALQKYGMFLADNGSDWFISGAHDPRWNDEAIQTLRRIRGRDLEVVQMEGLVVGR
jgi:hypothetical protein